jgi:FkbM family methyltransferase
MEPLATESAQAHRIRKWNEAVAGHVSGTIGVIIPHINDGDVVLDVGANTGLITAGILKRRPNCVLHLFEPVAELLAACRDRFVGMDNVHCHHFALTNTKENLPNQYTIALKQLYCGKKNLGWNTLVAGKVDDDNRDSVRTIESVGFDDYNAAVLKIEHVHFVKIDVEGHEYKVLAGMLDTIARDRPILYTEVAWGSSHPHWDEEKAVFQKIFDIGYEPFDLDKVTCTRDVLLRPKQ